MNAGKVGERQGHGVEATLVAGACGITAALAVLIIQIKDRVIPLLEQAKGGMNQVTDTATRIKGTTEFITEEAVRPLMNLTGRVSRLRTMRDTVTGKNTNVKKLAKQACKLNPDDCGLVEGQYKDAIYQFVTPVEEEAKKRWKDTLARASQMGVTNDYVKKARENLSKYLPDEFPYIKDERIGMEYP